MRPVLVTGAGGYLGQHLTAHLAEAGQAVCGLSRSPRPAAVPAVKWIQGDISDSTVSARSVTGCEAVVHLAGLPLGASLNDPAEALRVNEGVTQAMLEAAWRAGVERFVYISTGQVYGGQAPLPNSENQPPEPGSAYAASKLAGEVWCQAYSRAHGLPVTILRLFNVYGAALNGVPRPTVETRMLQNLRAGQPPQVCGHPESGRDFVHVRDVVAALELALAGPADADFLTLNVGTGVGTSLVALGECLARIVHRAVVPEVHDDGRPLIRYQADTTRAQETLGFRAQVMLEAGLNELVEGQ